MLKHKGRLKVVADTTVITKSCTTDWNNFIIHSLEKDENEFLSILLRTTDEEGVRVKIDDHVVFEGLISALLAVFTKADSSLSDTIFVDKVSSVVYFKISLEGSVGKNLAVDRRKESGTGNLTISGYILSYGDGV